jgi:hypothetical protein
MKAQTAIEIKERPILFSGPMVSAILAGRKTQTRRVVKPQPDWIEEVKTTRYSPGPFIWPIGGLGQQCGAPIFKFPYGKPGDRLWVRETFLDGLAHRSDAERGSREDVYYRADGDAHEQFEDYTDAKWRPSIFMPRWASRITLEITNVRVERLQDISPADVMSEGFVKFGNGTNYVPGLEWAERDPQKAYARLWDIINGKKYPWESNPWVWVIEFRKLDQK